MIKTENSREASSLRIRGVSEKQMRAIERSNNQKIKLRNRSNHQRYYRGKFF